MGYGVFDASATTVYTGNSSSMTVVVGKGDDGALYINSRPTATSSWSGWSTIGSWSWSNGMGNIGNPRIKTDATVTFSQYDTKWYIVLGGDIPPPG